MVNALTIVIWLFVNIVVMITFQLANFEQTRPDVVNTSILNKLLISEFWATLEWIFVIILARISYTFLNPIQMSLFTYVFVFLGMILSNAFWLKLPTTLDDYIGMIVIVIGMYITFTKLFG